MLSRTAIVFMLTSCALIQATNAQRKIVCYYQSWNSYAGIQPEDFDANLCTHVNYAFIGINNEGKLVPDDANLDVNQGLYQRVADMKKRNGNLKVLLSVGGGKEGVAGIFSAVAADPNKRKNLINSAHEYLSKYNMDGLDIDWELPQANDKQNYINLIREIKNDFNSKGWLLTAAVSANPGAGYDVAQMGQIYDFINVMTYDFYGPWSQYTGHQSALFANPIESDWEKQNLNFAVAIDHWTQGGAPANKLVMGLAFYGRSFTLADPSKNGIHAPIAGAGVDDGAPKYRDICAKYQGWTRVWVDSQKVPYKFNNNQWFGYEDEQSIGLKVDYIKQKNVGGAMIWAIDSDDVKGACGTKQVLLRKVQGVK